jgi:hypothetical protein
MLLMVPPALARLFARGAFIGEVTYVRDPLHPRAFQPSCVLCKPLHKIFVARSAQITRGMISGAIDGTTRIAKLSSASR